MAADTAQPIRWRPKEPGQILSNNADANAGAKEERSWRVVFHNDDYTPMDFVTAVFVRYFNKGASEAEAIMLTIHHTGAGTAGVYPKDIALTKVQQACEIARVNDHPLRVTAERT